MFEIAILNKFGTLLLYTCFAPNAVVPLERGSQHVTLRCIERFIFITFISPVGIQLAEQVSVIEVH